MSEVSGLFLASTPFINCSFTLAGNSKAIIFSVMQKAIRNRTALEEDPCFWPRMHHFSSYPLGQKASWLSWAKWAPQGVTQLDKSWSFIKVTAYGSSLPWFFPHQQVPDCLRCSHHLVSGVFMKRKPSAPCYSVIRTIMTKVKYELA